MFDADGDGIISVDEFKAAMRVGGAGVRAMDGARWPVRTWLVLVVACCRFDATRAGCAHSCMLESNIILQPCALKAQALQPRAWQQVCQTPNKCRITCMTQVGLRSLHPLHSAQSIVGPGGPSPSTSCPAQTAMPAQELDQKKDLRLTDKYIARAFAEADRSYERGLTFNKFMDAFGGEQGEGHATSHPACWPLQCVGCSDQGHTVRPPRAAALQGSALLCLPHTLCKPPWPACAQGPPAAPRALFPSS